jgi:hypothetical protein
MTLALDPKLALSALETEALRQLRSRLNKPAVSDAAKSVLGKVFFDSIVRYGLAAEPPAPGGQPPALAALTAQAHAADLPGLRQVLGHLAALREKGGPGWAKALADGAPQAVISRRLALAGREPPKIPAEA